MFLKYEDMWDMAIGGTDTENEIPHWWGNICYAAIGGICKTLFRYRVDGRENLRGFKGQSGVLIVCNHTSFLDVVFIFLAARPTQWARLIGRDSLFDNAHGLLGQILSRTGAFPIKRDTADLQAIKRAVRMLKNDEVVAILPEGTRRGKGSKTPSLHGGAAAIARMAHVPILPMTVRNAEKVKQKGKFLRFPKITVEYGDPLEVGDFNFLPKEDRVDACTWYAMRECFALFYNCPPEQVDMKELFPESKDYTEIFAEHPIPHHTTAEIVDAIAAKKAQKAAQKGQSETAAPSAKRWRRKKEQPNARHYVFVPEATE